MADSIAITDRIAVRRARFTDIPRVADFMRAADRAEVLALSGKTPFDALADSVRRSDYAFTVTVDGLPEAIFGVGTVTAATGVGAPWFLSTDRAFVDRRAFLRASVVWRDMFLRRFPVLRNVVDDRNELSRRWLAWLGFSLSEPRPLLYGQHMIRVFEMRRDDV